MVNVTVAEEVAWPPKRPREPRPCGGSWFKGIERRSARPR